MILRYYSSAQTRFRSAEEHGYLSSRPKRTENPGRRGEGKHRKERLRASWRRTLKMKQSRCKGLAQDTTVLCMNAYERPSSAGGSRLFWSSLFGSANASILLLASTGCLTTEDLRALDSTTEFLVFASETLFLMAQATDLSGVCVLVSQPDVSSLNR